MTDLAPVHDRAAGPVDDPPAGPADDATTAPLPNPGSVPVTERPLVLVGLVTALVALSFLPDGIRWITTPLAFWLPGHALVTAVFGRRLEFGGVRRICLELLLTLATYPILALAVFSLAIPMSHETVAVSTWLFVAGCAAVAEVRQRRGARRHGAAGRTAAAPPRTPAVDVRQLLVPGLAIAAMLLIAWGSVHVLPRAEPVPFSSAALAGPWSLVTGAVPYDAGVDPSIDVAVTNQTGGDEDYTVTAVVRAADGTTTSWPTTSASLSPGESRTVTVSGPLPAGQCRAQVAVAVTPDRGPALD
ncbi:MAG: DUF1616 domain-containing protein, partial [Acidimicrobiales bacterium]